MDNDAIKAYNKVVLKKLRKRVTKLLSDNHMPYDFTVDEQGYVKISVENGDWKHDHLCLRQMMNKAGFVFFGRHIPEEETGEDVFSAVYLFR